MIIFLITPFFVDERRHGGPEHNQDEAVQGEASQEEVVQVCSHLTKSYNTERTRNYQKMPSSCRTGIK